MKVRSAATAATPARAALDVRHAPLRRRLRDNGLSIALCTLVVVCITGQTLAGHAAYNADQRDHGQPEIGLVDYVRSDHFGEATAENWESEFLQMAAFLWLTALLFQRGSAESRDPDGREPKRPPPPPDRRPWPVRRGGAVRWIYARSLGLAFGLLFLGSFWWHAATGAAHYSAEQLVHGGEPVTAWSYVRTSQFWFESFQNWQSEFLAILSMTVLSIFLRQDGSPESKDVETPHGETGK